MLTLGPSIGHRTIWSFRGGPTSIRGRALRLSAGGPFVYQREGALRLSGGPLTLRHLTLEGLPSVIGPSVGQRGLSVYQMGPSVGQMGPPSARGAPVDQISPPSVKKYILGQRGPPSFNTRKPYVCHRTICQSEGALCRSEGAHRLSEGALYRSD